MKVSVALFTYNHEPYIAQALESTLRQDVDFDYEVVVGEDCSTDRTREMVLDFQRQHPERIRLVLHDQNVGCNQNVADTLAACRGEYLALLDGDDYWTSPAKLQRQADYLDRHPECAICCHQVVEGPGDGADGQCAVPPTQKETGTFDDLVAGYVVLTCATMLRRRLVTQLPPWFGEVLQPDFVLKLLAAEHGTIGFLPPRMAFYRISEGGIWRGASLERRWKAQLQVYERINAHTNRRHDRAVRRAMATRYLDMACLFEAQGDLKSARSCLARMLKTAPLARTGYGRELRAMFKTFFPWLSTTARNILGRGTRG